MENLANEMYLLFFFVSNGKLAQFTTFIWNNLSISFFYNLKFSGNSGYLFLKAFLTK